ncbi:tRNA(His) guanylyltransferase Thg1 family protein [Labrenzia sp. VG12]|uniref:tRNA(His) guanylyltransferase Thg1 family protein n=1 Tax=Labrenzia sp. VG12 TaxID=2021862 RepID=UPI000B8BF018|nr:tRNA(His) guanylyltransferase Thg1 family protein [Labrenzia sp. VG12]ASP34695.1 guanylyltransferase [Labrenzia sp. VG12]
MRFDVFDQKMRQFENSLDQPVPDSDWIVLRLDGRGFTRLTKDLIDLDKPFDLRFHRAMQATCEHLMDAGPNFKLCYTQSDEISLLMKGTDVPFAGKTRKLNSVHAGEASACFSLKIGRPCAFDCRVIPLPETEDAVDYFRWRQEDARRNSLTAFCYWHLRSLDLSPNAADEQMNGMSTAQKLDLLDQHGIDYADQPDWMRIGAFLARESIKTLGMDPRSGTTSTALRNRLVWLEHTPEGQAVANLVADTCNDA